MKRGLFHCYLLLLPLLSIGGYSQSTPDDTQAIPSTVKETQSQPGGVQDEAASYESTTVLHVTTHMVIVDVVVQDAQGHTVNDLRREEFKLRENGHDQKLSMFSFQQHDAQRPTRVAPKHPANVFTNSPDYNPSDALNVILLDSMNTSVAKQLMVQRALLETLPTLSDGRPIAIYAMSEKLRQLHDFTTNTEALTQAAKNYAPQSAIGADDLQGNGGSPGGLTAGDQTRIANNAIGNGRKDLAMGVSRQRADGSRASHTMDYRVQSTISLLKSLARALSGYPGRKNVLWLSQGFPFSIHPDPTMGVARFDNTRGYEYELAELADAMMGAQVTIYPINVGGVEVSGSMPNIEAPHDTMRYLAEQSGGRVFVDTNDFTSGMKQSIEDGSTYYTLSYYSDNKKYDGKYRNIEITTNRPGLKLHYRPGYFAVDPDAFQKLNEKQRDRDFGEAMDIEYPSASGLLFQAVVQQPSEKTQNKVEVDFFIDPHAIRYDSSIEGDRKSVVTCAVKVYDAQGRDVKAQAQQLNANLKDDIYDRTLKSSFPCQQKFDLAAGSYLLRLGVRDDHS